MWYYRFRDSSPLNKRVLKGLLIQKGEWTEARVKMDFGAFTRFMEDKFEQTKELEQEVKSEVIVKSETIKEVQTIKPEDVGDISEVLDVKEVKPPKKTRKKKENTDA